MSPVAAPGPDEARPESIRWQECIRAAWDSLDNERARDRNPLEVIWGSAKEADVSLDWRHLSQAFLMLGFAEWDRPAHVAGLVRELADASNARSVLDPYAAAPTFIAHVAEATAVTNAVAIVPNADLARAMAGAATPKITWLPGRVWELGRKVEALAEADGSPMAVEALGQFDLIACSPPLGLSVREELPGSVPLSLYRRELGYWLLADSIVRRGNAGRVAFHVSDSLFTKKEGRDLFAWLAVRGLHLNAAISVVGGGGLGTSLPMSIAVFSQDETDELLVGRIAPEQGPERLVENILSRHPGKAPENGLLVNRDEFRGWVPLEAQLELKRRLRVSTAQIRPLSEIAASISPLRLRKGQQFEPASNAIYLYETSNRVTLDPPDAPVKEKSVFRAFEVALDPAIVSAAYATWWLSTEIGQHARKGLSTGAYIPHLSLAAVGQIRIVVPSQPDQSAALSLDERLKALREEIVGIEEQLSTRPQAALDLSERLDAYWEDPFEAWADRLPFPLASIVDRYIADASTDTRVDRLLHFFEAFAEFGVAVLLAVVHRDPALWEAHREQLAEPGPNGKHALEEATFGGWTSLGFKLAKVLRSQIEQADDPNELRRTLFAIDDVRFSTDMTSTSLWNSLDKARSARNRLSHGEVVGSPAKARLLAELKEILSRVRETTAHSFSRAVLIEPGPGEFDGEVHYYQSARHLRGASSNLRQRPLESLVQLKSRSTYFIGPAAPIVSALELVPLFRLMPAPETEESTVYFTAGRRDGGYRLITYHASSEGQPRIEPSPELDRLLRELTGE